VRGRTLGEEPWCRSLCIRKVFPHEVRKILRVVESGPQGTVEKEVEVEAKIPLPPEGQNLPRWLTGRGRPEHAADDDGDGDDEDVGSLKGWKSVVNDVQREGGRTGQEAGKMGGPDSEVWKQGWYVWTTKNKWAVHEKLDSMVNDLERQAEWAKTKQEVNEEWEQGRKASAMADAHPSSVSGPSTTSVHPTTEQEPHPQTVSSVVFVSEDSLTSLPTPPFPDASASTVLLPVPPPLPPFKNYMANLFAPTAKALKLTRESVVSGDQRRLVERIWEKAKTDEPWVLAKTVMERTWQVINSDNGGDDENDRRKER
jgi:hypothetical protein